MSADTASFKKKCPICLKEKSSDNYYKDKQISDGLRTYCKICWNKKSNKWNNENQQYKNELTKKWRENNPNKVSQYKKKNHFKQSYGMTLEQVEEFKASRNNKCDICGGFRK